VLIAPPGLELPEKYVDLAERRGHRIIRTSDLRQGLADCDVVYTTRVQRERFPEGAEPVGYTSDFRINRQLVDACCPPDTVIMHPLPRDSRPEANDLSDDLDGDPRLAIFRQTDAGVPTRMALFAMVLGVEDRIEASLQTARWWRPARIGPKDADFHRG
jgi:aspartate carbamoyltransferase catalytic subunit